MSTKGAVIGNGGGPNGVPPEITRKVLTPWELSLGSPAPSTGLNWPSSVETKLVITVVPSVLPNGFDLYTTPQGPAIRFIGSGLGNGDTANFALDAAFAVNVVTGSGTCIFRGKTRPYTEADFANAVDINYVGMSRKFPNNDLGSLPMTPQIITLSDGDLLEFSCEPDANFSSVTIEWGAIVLREV